MSQVIRFSTIAVIVEERCKPRSNRIVAVQQLKPPCSIHT